MKKIIVLGLFLVANIAWAGWTNAPPNPPNGNPDPPINTSFNPQVKNGPFGILLGLDSNGVPIMPAGALDINGNTFINGFLAITGGKKLGLYGTGSKVGIALDPDLNPDDPEASPTKMLDINGGEIRLRTRADGTAPHDGDVLTTDATGVGSWATPAGGSGSIGPGTVGTLAMFGTGTTVVDSLFKQGGSPGYGIAIGTGNVVTGSAVAIGRNNSANGNQSIAMGFGSNASGSQATAMGTSVANGNQAMAMGAGSTASGAHSTAMGYASVASGSESTALGKWTTASGDTSTAMGHSTTASGQGSIATGLNTLASGLYSTVMGTMGTAQSYGSLVIGRFNSVSGTTDSWVAGDPLFVAGNGGSAGNLSNALTLLKNGNLTIAGSLKSDIWTGTENSFLCVHADGTVFRKDTACNTNLEV